MTILTGSLTSLQLSGSNWVQRKDTGAEVLCDIDFTQLANQTFTNDAFNSIAGISTYVLTNGSPYFQIKNGEGLSYSDAGTGFAYIYYNIYTTFTGSNIKESDRFRVVAEFSGTKSSAAASTDPDYYAIGLNSAPNQLLFTTRGPDSGNSNKFTHLNIWTTNNYASNANVVTLVDSTTSILGACRMEIDGTAENWYTAADRGTFSPPGLTDFPIPGEITPQGRMRMLTNTGMPKLVTNYVNPFSSSALTQIFVGFDSNQAGELSGTLKRVTIFKYGAD